MYHLRKGIRHTLQPDDACHLHITKTKVDLLKIPEERRR